jgi:serine/threonine protein phosphatase PrpC
MYVFGRKKEKSPVVEVTIPPPVRDAQHHILIGNMHHIGARENQQDSFGISDVSNTELVRRMGVFGVVADGMGGLADGAEISNIVTRTMLQCFNEAASSGLPELDLLNMLSAANNNVNSFMAKPEQGGSTVVAVIIKNEKLYWAAVGDSRICLIRGGAVIQINREHVFAVDLDEKAALGEISWEAALGDPQRAALTSYLGMGKPEKIDRNIRPLQLLAGDRLLLMSDGVFGALTDNEILSAMLPEPFASAQSLQEKVLGKQNPSQDNLTAVIFEIRGEVL